jgi:glycosyltransferase involved in cell wall biosynthesis
MKVFIAPTYRKSDNADGGIRRVSEALWKYLPQFGIEPTDNPDETDLFNLHGASLVERPGIPVVASNHGLYWEDYKFEKWADETNKQVVAVMSRAKAITAPSRWVAHAITRGMLVQPRVIYHGVDADAWAHSEQPDSYVLWNKARSDAVSNPDDMQTLAALMKGQKFVSTLGQQTNNVHISGIMPIEEMRPIIQRAGVYLATARETFGIGTLEAMAAGVPVAGWDYGGQHEIIIPGETGYLAPHGDYHALAECVARCLAERKRLSANCVEDIRARWGWADKIERYAEIFKSVYDGERATRCKVSVVVLSHNLGRYLPDALNSLLAQTMNDWECIIVDDCSEDNTRAVALDFVMRDNRFTYHRTPENLKLSGARNFGATFATGKYLQFLDADDLLDAQALAILSTALDNDITIHVASGHLDTINGDNMERSRGNGWPPPQFDYHAQLAHLNQLPYAALWRKEVFEAVGGYRRRAWRAEDAETWIRVSSFGYRIAKVTEHSTLVYRFRDDSKSHQEMKAHPDRDGDWTSWFPWRIAGNPQDGSKLWKRGAKTPPFLTPWGAQGNPPDNVRYWAVKHHSNPVVSVIIPCGPTHERYLIDAVESVMAQTFIDWEVIVVNDTGKKWGDGLSNPLAGAPYVRMVAGPRKGPGAARNAGARLAKGQCLLFLDADDYLLPQTLEMCVHEWRQSGRVVYFDHLISRGVPGQPLESYACEDWECSRYMPTDTGEKLVGVLFQMKHSNCFLLPKIVYDKCGGYDETDHAHEDHDFQIRIEATGACSVRLPMAGFVYRLLTGVQRNSSLERWGKDKYWLRDQWIEYYRGDKEMPCGSCPGGSIELPTLPQPMAEELPPEDAVLIEYMGNQKSPFLIMMEGMTTSYKFANNEQHRTKYVRIKDAAILLAVHRFGRAEYQQVERPRPQAPTPLNVIPGPPPNKPLPDMSEFVRERA